MAILCRKSFLILFIFGHAYFFSKLYRNIQEEKNDFKGLILFKVSNNEEILDLRQKTKLRFNVNINILEKYQLTSIVI